MSHTIKSTLGREILSTNFFDHFLFHKQLFHKKNLQQRNWGKIGEKSE
jgi:hypothetical protein